MKVKNIELLAAALMVIMVVVPIGASATDAFGYGQWSRIYNTNAQWTKNQAETIDTLRNTQLHIGALWYNYQNPYVTVDKVGMRESNDYDGVVRFYNVTQTITYGQQIPYPSGVEDTNQVYATGTVGSTYTVYLQHFYHLTAGSTWYTDTSGVKQYHLVG